MRPIKIGDAVRPKLERSSLRFSRLSNVKSLGFKVVTVPASLGANALMFTVQLIAINVAYQGISPGLVAADVAAETLGVSKCCKCCKTMGRVFSLSIFCTSVIYVTLFYTCRSFFIRRESLDMPFPISLLKGDICSYDQYFFLIILI